MPTQKINKKKNFYSLELDSPIINLAYIYGFPSAVLLIEITFLIEIIVITFLILILFPIFRHNKIINKVLLLFFTCIMLLKIINIEYILGVV